MEPETGFDALVVHNKKKLIESLGMVIFVLGLTSYAALLLLFMTMIVTFSHPW